MEGVIEMNLSKQIKKYRDRDGLSQEKLAEKIYVSRQTISNWETGRSYPDIHNLLLLSVLFNVSLDELVKGDVEAMKESIKNNEITKISGIMSWIMIIFMALATLSIGPSLKFFGNKGYIIPVIFYAVSMIAAMKLEKIKKDNNIKTYAEIVAFMENGDVNSARAQRNKKKDFLHKALIVLGFSLTAGVLAFISVYFFR